MAWKRCGVTDVAHSRGNSHTCILALLSGGRCDLRKVQSHVATQGRTCSVAEPSRQLNPIKHLDVSKCLCLSSVLLILKIQIQLAEEFSSGTEVQNQTETLH